ncbi:glycosyltransferase [Winogradskyella psychrotolerans]|uniref:glycosyltransferase n=1 Tax=Winogradskyella psychrotolerans TaxID=1344585 RepID=UPI001C06FCC1|nr:glycosyltransferase [Winogradskyella psychrotolerans]MBU2929540.1 glycosyltransferase [Winogradskyella psychrotolerans]
MKLAIISHTEHYKTVDGTLVGWGPTISEINHLLSVFDTIYHVAMFHHGKAPASALPYHSDRVIFVPLPALGGATIGSKFDLLLKAPVVLKHIHSTLKKVDYFQFRGPTGIGVYVIPFLVLCVKKSGWFKYAGNWNQKQPPLGYRLQRWMMKNQSRLVTINGSWENQPSHCITFENPCLTETDLLEGEQVSLNKTIDGALTFCFVGRLEKPKGVERIILALTNLPEHLKNRVNVVHLVGEGEALDYFKSIAATSGINIKFHGALPRERVFEIYKESHVFLMPTTASEGFPKVIAEAMNFGCLPIVSSVSSISQYIKTNETGICLTNVASETVTSTLILVLNMDVNLHQKILRNQRVVVNKFSFSHYNRRVLTEITDYSK